MLRTSVVVLFALGSASAGFAFLWRVAQPVIPGHSTNAEPGDHPPREPAARRLETLREQLVREITLQRKDLAAKARAVVDAVESVRSAFASYHAQVKAWRDMSGRFVQSGADAGDPPAPPDAASLGSRVHAAVRDYL